MANSAKDMKILYYGGCWPTNIGNAFIDYGSLYTIKTAAPEADVYFASEFPRWVYKTNRRAMDKSFDVALGADIDVLVFSGMALCDDFIQTEGPILKMLSQRGTKIVINACGGATYEKLEVDNFRRFLESIKIEGFISRDEMAYESYKDCCAKSYNGIDCAFFLPHAFNCLPMLIKDYVVYNFDHTKEPNIKDNRKIIRAHHRCSGKLPRRWLQHADTLISDIPDDYLNLYANTCAVYSDRVHACIAALSFGKSARLYSDTPRAYLFERVGVSQIKEKLVTLDQDKLNREQKEQISFLKEIFGKK